MNRAGRFLTEAASSQKFEFTTQQVSEMLGTKKSNAQSMIRTMRKNGRISTPHRSFHVITPAEYKHLDSIPAFHYLDQLMNHLKEPYYISLLSAAELHGAAHQKPQVLQVMLKRNRRRISCGDVHIQFVARKDMDKMPVERMNTVRGTINVATPELTAFELMGYSKKTGGINNATTILMELSEKIDAMKLDKLAQLQPVGWVQRLGFLLDYIGEIDLSKSLAHHVRKRVRTFAPLLRCASTKGCARDSKWKLIINTELDPDI